MNQLPGKPLFNQLSYKESDSSKEILNISKPLKILKSETKTKVAREFGHAIKLKFQIPVEGDLNPPVCNAKTTINKESILSLDTKCFRGETQATSNCNVNERSVNATLYSHSSNLNASSTIKYQKSKWCKLKKILSITSMFNTIEIKRIKTMKEFDNHIRDWKSTLYSKKASRLTKTERKCEPNQTENRIKHIFDNSYLIKRAIDIIEM